MLAYIDELKKHIENARDCLTDCSDMYDGIDLEDYIVTHIHYELLRWKLYY
jgi:hypothetical protein